MDIVLQFWKMSPKNIVGKDRAQKWPNCAHLDKSMKFGWLIV